MAGTKFFSSVLIDDKTTQITGLSGENCYLLEGDERALLIDSLTGVGSLKAFVRELTDLPVTVVLTHGHMDHCGAVYEYGECRMHPDDIIMRALFCSGSVHQHSISYTVGMTKTQYPSQLFRRVLI